MLASVFVDELFIPNVEFLRNYLMHKCFITLRGCSKDGMKRLLCFLSTVKKHGRMNTWLEHA